MRTSTGGRSPCWGQELNQLACLPPALKLPLKFLPLLLSSAQVSKSILLLITHDKTEARQNTQTSLCQRLAITRGTKHGEVHARQYEHNTCPPGLWVRRGTPSPAHLGSPSTCTPGVALLSRSTRSANQNPPVGTAGSCPHSSCSSTHREAGFSGQASVEHHIQQKCPVFIKEMIWI